jgi:hypothetical protein
MWLRVYCGLHFERSNKKQDQYKFYADGNRGGTNAWDKTTAIIKPFKELVMSADL